MQAATEACRIPASQEAAAPAASSLEETTMTAVKFAIRQAHGMNIDRYQRLLKTHLSDVERRYIASRLLDEQAAMQAADRSATALSSGEIAPGNRSLPGSV